MIPRQILLALAALTISIVPAAAQQVSLNESGSTLMYPLFQLWIADYAKANPHVTITPAATGSGAGEQAALSGKAAIGASDAYLSDEQAEQNRQFVDIPLAISAQTINYNVPGLNNPPLKLDGDTLAAIYSGRITEWDAAPIAAMNPGVKLPHQQIVPVRRADGSGDTFIFTQFLDFTNQQWSDGIGYGTSVAWPQLATERAATGNDGMVKTLAATPYSIGYVGISFGNAATKAGIGSALLKNQYGSFLSPTPEIIAEAASNLDQRTPADERLTLVYAPGANSYALINYEYVVISTQQPDPQTASALRSFLTWAVGLQGGNAPKYLDAVGFVALPDFIRALSEQQIDRIR